MHSQIAPLNLMVEDQLPVAFREPSKMYSALSGHGVLRLGDRVGPRERVIERLHNELPPTNEYAGQ